MNFAIAGIGYVELSNAVLLAQSHNVTTYDISESRVQFVNNWVSPIIDAELESYLQNESLNLNAVTDPHAAFKDADYIIIATPTNYDPVKNFFDTSRVESIITSVCDKKGLT